MKFIELFAGIGGFRYGLEKCNENNFVQLADKSSVDTSIDTRSFACVWSVEIDKYACQIYRKNFGRKEYEEWMGGQVEKTVCELYEGDIKKVKAEEIPDHDLLTAGFPCQSFSIAGKRGGFDDVRGTLFFEIARIVREKQPCLLLLENVKGLLSHEKGRTFATILSTLDEIGYDLQWQVLNSKNFGVPQNRERVFIIGHLRGTSRPEVFPIGEGNKVNDKIQQQQDKEKARSSCLASRYGQRWTDETYIKRGIKIRRLTPTECERLQGFLDGWTEGVSDTQRYKALGNAVTTNVITEIGKRLKEE